MSDIVLLHGSWLGGWMWEDIGPALAREGHTVSVPTLSAEGGLDDHVVEVIADIADRANITLVAHSYAGMVATATAARLPEQVRQVIYLDAFVPNEGQCAFDVLPDIRTLFESTVGPDGAVPPLPPQAFGVTADDEAARIAERMRPWPLKTHERGSAALPAGVERVFIQFAYGDFFTDLARVLETQSWTVERLDVGHLAPITDPGMIVEVLRRHVMK